MRQSVRMDEPLMTPEEVQKLLNITPRQLRYMREKGDIPFFRLRGESRFARKDVEAYLTSQKVGVR